MYRISNTGRGQTGRNTDGLGTTRRAVLAAGGTAALAALAGCSALDGLLDRAGDEAVGTTGASPAAFYDGSSSADGGGGRTAVHGTTSTDVRYVPPTLQAASRDIEIDGWSTSTTTKAQDYNSSRSNKPSTIWWPGPGDGDVDGDGIDDLIDLLDIERSLLVYADAAIEAADDQSGDDATTTLDAFITATTTAIEKGERCPSETCGTVAENAVTLTELAQDASDAVDAGEWDRARRSLQEARRIVQGDITGITDAEDFPDWPGDPDSDGDGISDGMEPLYDYLDGEPTIGERFVVSLPDAKVRGDGPELVEELTPERVLSYFLGERNGESCGESDRAVAVH